MKRKELTTIFMMASNCRKPLVSMVYTTIFQRCKGSHLRYYSGLFWIIRSIPRVTAISRDKHAIFRNRPACIKVAVQKPNDSNC